LPDFVPRFWLALAGSTEYIRFRRVSNPDHHLRGDCRLGFGAGIVLRRRRSEVIRLRVGDWARDEWQLTQKDVWGCVIFLGKLRPWIRRLRYAKVAAIIVIANVGVLVVQLLVGVWLPDVISAPRNVLAEERRANGESVRVIQYWNHSDFYSTELEYVGTNGILTKCTLDGDDSKSWRAPLIVDWDEKKAKVTLGGGRLRAVDLVRGERER
jgi:hypothetical protein